MRPSRDHIAPGAVSADLKVRVDRIGDGGLDLDEELSRAWIDGVLGADSPYRASRDGRLSVHLATAERVVHVRGRTQIGVLGACVRCLGPVDLAIDVPIEVALFPRGEEPEPSSDGELVMDDMGVSTYEEGVVDLGGVVHDEVFLELPMNPVCAESCVGLCPRCGTNLNDARCACSPAADERWQALPSLKVD